MPAPFGAIRTVSVDDGALVGDTEIVIATIAGVDMGDTNRWVLIIGVAAFTAGASTGAINLHVHKGVIGGTVVGPSFGSTVTPTKDTVIAFMCVDESPGMADGVYVVTAAQNGSSGDGTFNQVAVVAIPF